MGKKLKILVLTATLTCFASSFVSAETIATDTVVQSDTNDKVEQASYSDELTTEDGFRYQVNSYGTVLTFSNIANAKTFNEVSSTASSQNSKLQEALKNIGIELYPAKKCWITDVNDKVDVNGTPIEDYTTYYVDDYINPTVVYEWNDSNESFSKVNKNCYIIPYKEPFHFIGFPKDQLIIGYKDATPDLPKDQTHIIIPILEDAWTNDCKRYNKNPLRADYYLDANDEEVYYSGYVNNYLNPTEAYSKDKYDGGLRIDSKVGNNRYNGIFSSNTLHRQQNKKGYKVLGWKDTTPNLPSNEAHKIVAITTEDFPDAKYYIGKEFFTRAYVDNLENPTKVYDNYNNKDNPIKDFANVNDSRNTSSKIEDYIPEGYIFKGWKVRGYNEKYKFTEVDAILEKDQEYIDKMDFSYSDVKVHGFESTGRDYLSFKVSDKNYKIISATADNDEYGFHYTFMKNNNQEKIDDIRTGVREDYNIPDDYEVFNLGEFLDGFNCDKYTINVVLENRLGKQLHVTKTVDKEETTYKNTYNHGGIIYRGPNNIKMNYVSDVTVGSRIYFYNMPSNVFDTVAIIDSVSNNIMEKDSYKKGTDSNGCYIEFVKDGGKYPGGLTPGLYDGCLLTIADGTGRTYTNNIVYHAPKQQEPETPVEPATKTPEETPVEPATETPAEEQATKTPEETKPAKPSNTSDASNVIVALAGLTLAGAVVAKTKKNA